MLPIKIVKNFITEKEKDILNSWSLENYKELYFSDPKMNRDENQTRFTTRHSYGRIDRYKNYKVKYPDEVYDIQERLFSYLNVDFRSIIPWPSFTDGIVTTVAFPPGSCDKHIDPVYYSDTYTVHCNFITQKPKSGGITFIENEYYDASETDMIMYVTSHLQHGATEIEDDTPRILWVYGFCLNEDEIKSVFNLSSTNFFNKVSFEYK